MPTAPRAQLEHRQLPASSGAWQQGPPSAPGSNLPNLQLLLKPPSSSSRVSAAACCSPVASSTPEMCFELIFPLWKSWEMASWGHTNGQVSEGRWDGYRRSLLQPAHACTHFVVPPMSCWSKAVQCRCVFGSGHDSSTVASRYDQPRPWFLGSWWYLCHFAVIDHLPRDTV